MTRIKNKFSVKLQKMMELSGIILKAHHFDGDERHKWHVNLLKYFRALGGTESPKAS